jgi:hypothetical protein
MAITEPYSPTAGAGSTTVSSVTVTSPGTVLTDDIVLVMFAIRQDRTITTPSGWSVVSHSRGTGKRRRDPVPVLASEQSVHVRVQLQHLDLRLGVRGACVPWRSCHG